MNQPEGYRALGVARDPMVFPLGEPAGDIWVAKLDLN